MVTPRSGLAFRGILKREGGAGHAEGTQPPPLLLRLSSLHPEKIGRLFLMFFTPVGTF